MARTEASSSKRTPMGYGAAEDLAGFYRAFGCPTRLMLMELIYLDPARYRIVDLGPVVARSQPTISHHIKILVAAKLVRRNKHGLLSLTKRGAQEVESWQQARR